MLPRPDSELATPGADNLGDNLSFTLLSSPSADHFAPYPDNFSLDIAQDGLTGDLFGLDTTLDWFGDGLNSAPFIDSPAARDPRPYRHRQKARGKPMVLRPFESCLAVELAVKQLKSAFTPTPPA
jgi:hypothetical protein